MKIQTKPGKNRFKRFLTTASISQEKNRQNSIGKILIDIKHDKSKVKKQQKLMNLISSFQKKIASICRHEQIPEKIQSTQAQYDQGLSEQYQNQYNNYEYSTHLSAAKIICIVIKRKLNRYMPQYFSRIYESSLIPSEKDNNQLLIILEKAKNREPINEKRIPKRCNINVSKYLNSG